MTGTKSEVGMASAAARASSSLSCAIEVDDVSMDYARQGEQQGTKRNADSPEPAVAEVSFSLAAGEVVALVGTTGCGKTTVLNLIAGLMAPTNGNVHVRGNRATCPNREVSYVQARDALLPWRTAIKNVELPLEVEGVSRAQRHERASSALGVVGLQEYSRFTPLHLSQGMRQRVSLARALVTEPPILLMDEPFGALDARTRLEIQTMFLSLVESQRPNQQPPVRKTVVLVTHDLQEATLLADRILIMSRNPGRIVDDVRVDISRPRCDRVSEIIFSQQFNDLGKRLFDSLESGIGSGVS